MEQKKIWDYWQTEGVKSFSEARVRLGYLAKLSHVGDRVLNIGVGDGSYERLALKRGLEVYSLDPSEKAVEALRQTLLLGARAKVGYGQNIPFPDGFFAAVIVSEVMEHLTDEVNEKMLAEIRRALRPGGRLIGTVPARENLSAQMVVCPDCGKIFHRWGHVQSWDLQRMRVLLLKFFDHASLNEKLFPCWASLNWRGRVVTFIRWVLTGLGCRGNGRQILFIATKAEGLMESHPFSGLKREESSRRG